MYIGPVPQENYTAELDTIILPTALVNSTTPDEIQEPYSEAVAFYAAYKAKYYEQSYGEAEIFKQEYMRQIQGALTSTFTRRLPTPYSTAY